MFDRFGQQCPQKLVWVLACALCLTFVQADAALSADAQKSDEARALARVRELLDLWEGDSSVLRAAKAELDGILKTNPTSAPAHREYARYHIKNSLIDGSLRLGELAQAEQSLDAAVALSPEYAEAFVLRGHLYRLLKRKDEAYAALRRAREIGTDDPWLDLNWSDLLHDEGKYQEEVELCEAVIARAPSSHSAFALAHDCVIGAFTALGRKDEADAAHRAKIALEPAAAWPHGNYARFLLCVMDQPEAAVQEATTALRLMDYGMARGVLAAARYRLWAAQVFAGHAADEAKAWATATASSTDEPAQLMDKLCDRKTSYVILRALRDSKRGAVIVPMHAVLLAAEAADTTAGGAAGIFGLEVVATGRHGDSVFLNSEADYRDQRNLTVRFTAAGVSDFRKRHGADPDVALKGKRITVVGMVHRERIDFLTEGRRTGKFYYQTHVVVSESDQVAIFDPRVAPPADLPEGLRA